MNSHIYITNCLLLTCTESRPLWKVAFKHRGDTEAAPAVRVKDSKKQQNCWIAFKLVFKQKHKRAPPIKESSLRNCPTNVAPGAFGDSANEPPAPQPVISLQVTPHQDNFAETRMCAWPHQWSPSGDFRFNLQQQDIMKEVPLRKAKHFSSRSLCLLHSSDFQSLANARGLPFFQGMISCSVEFNPDMGPWAT